MTTEDPREPENDEAAAAHEEPEGEQPGKEPLRDALAQLQEMLKGANIQFIPFGGETRKPQAEKPAAEPEPDADDLLKRVREFNLKPREVKDYLDRFVIKQNDAKKVLSVAICDHYNYVRECLEHPEQADRNHIKSNILLMGPTGVGKTYLMRCIARLIGVPFVKADITKFSETGYVGYDVEDIVRDLVKLSDGNTEVAQYGIIYIDEIDKIANRSGPGGGKDVSGRGVQVNLLKLMEESDVNLFSQTDIIGQMRAMMEMQRGKEQKRTINTRHMLFIVSGAFDQLAEQVRKRVEKTTIGFVPDSGHIGRDATEYLSQSATRDFIDYGFEPEFIGRLPVRVACDQLTRDDLEQVLLKSEDSLLDQYRADFRGYGISMEIAKEAVGHIAERASKEKTGARGLMTVLETIFRDYKFELPSTTVKTLHLTEGAVTEPRETLDGLLQESRHEQEALWREDARRFAEQLGREDGFEICFDEEALDLVLVRSQECGKTIRGYCEERFKDLLYALKLIAQRSEKKAFTLNRKLVENSEREISAWVVESFKDEEE